ncbi:MAG: FKBP-type peptidyl-prolyl cis-trans isomerase [Flavobacteriales bacterium]|nr:FKBP-type peptidyl-prolyl cis-trans isomerase [Flavobacteriales bacterium]HRO40718.1 FKBP-type peptidyl-prolyl cis-trans isomerase [Flavobacteriales bacterium]HRP82916.1 FKBP-type peptidyl-prolyl cis-trans isomerase [Flavobacteriales bacterium]
MNIKLSIFSMLAVLLGACSNQATGQKGREIALSSTRDSVSYGVGSDVGHNLKMNLKQAGLDSLNIDALFAGMRDAMDSVERINSDKIKAVVQAYMIQAQQKAMAKQQAQDDVRSAEGQKFLAENGKKPGVVTTASGLQYEVLQMGTGPKPTADQTVRVHYKGTLIDGKEFDSSYSRGEPAEFPVNAVIPGWTEALQLMPVGSRWKLYIPSELGYGQHGAGEAIPGNSTLIFEVELLDIVKK